MYNNLVERCFRECSEDMRSKSLSSKEEQVRECSRRARRATIAWAPKAYMSTPGASCHLLDVRTPERECWFPFMMSRTSESISSCSCARNGPVNKLTLLSL